MAKPELIIHSIMYLLIVDTIEPFKKYIKKGVNVTISSLYEPKVLLYGLAHIATDFKLHLTSILTNTINIQY